MIFREIVSTTSSKIFQWYDCITFLPFYLDSICPVISTNLFLLFLIITTNINLFHGTVRIASSVYLNLHGYDFLFAPVE